MKPSAWGLFVAAAAFGASTIYLGMQLREERRRAEQFLEESQALNARIAALESLREAAYGAPPAVPESGSTALAAAATDPVAEAGKQAQPPAAVGLPAAEAGVPRPRERSAAAQKMLLSQVRGNNRRLYADVGAKLGLDRESTQQLIDLITEQQVSTLDRVREARLDPAVTDPRQTFEKVQQENLAQIAALIGADKMEPFRAYQETLPARQEVEALQRQLEGQDSGLSAEQRQRMITALSEERSRVPMPKLAEAATREQYLQALSQWQADYSARAEARAGSILTSEQLAEFSEYQQWSREMREQAALRQALRN